jgi:mono/diheme cytochrome c family protein
MTTRDRFLRFFLASAVLTGALLTAEIRAAGEDQGSPAQGSYLFKTYCASCHGTSARGDGPLAENLRRPPANLTEIAKRNNPRDLVYRIIDGRQKVPGHGGPDMPVWGDAFMRTADATEASVQQRIQVLVDYLETLQARDGQ